MGPLICLHTWRHQVDDRAWGTGAGGKVEAAPEGTAPLQKKLRLQPLDGTSGRCGGASSTTPTPAEDLLRPPSALAGPAGGQAEHVSAGT
jgi:hypothetical protein